MSQPNPEHKSQKQKNIVKDTRIGRDLTFAPQQIETYVETQIVEISTEKVTQKELNKSSPYKGLKRFNQSDRRYFFGRDALIAKLFNAVNKSNFTLVLGASGSGKSSVVRAGLIPEFKKSLDSQKLYDFIFTPNQDPFESLYRCLLGEEKDYRFKASDIEFVRQGKPNTLSELINKLKQDKKRSLFFIDQFEQLFINTNSEKRQNFVEGIVRVAKKGDSYVRIVLAMRSDFLEQFGLYPTLGAVANQNNIHLVTEMYPDELRQAIEQPAAKHGVVFESGLVKQIIKEVEGQSGYLPLLQQTLDLLWEKECTTKSADGRLCIENRILNKANYAALGGVRGSLQNYVDDVYRKICQENEDGELVTKQIFLKLVNIVESDSGTKAVSRRAYRYEFVGQSVVDILQRLIDKNLLVSNYEYLSEEEPLSQDSIKHKQNATVEIAHEILLSSWDRLKRWLEEEKEAIIIKNWLADETRRWSKVIAVNKAKASDELLKGSRLEQIVEFQKENAFEKLGGLSQQEKKFIDASIEWRKREAKLAKRSLQWTIGILTSGLITSSIFAVIAYRQLHTSRINEINAINSSTETLFVSNQKLNALISGLKAVKRMKNSWLGVDYKTQIMVLGKLQKIFYDIREVNSLKDLNSSEDLTNGINYIAFSPDGMTIATGNDDGTVKLWNPKGELLYSSEEGQSHLLSIDYVVFSPDGQTIATASQQDGNVKLWDLQGKLLCTLYQAGFPEAISPLAPHIRHMAYSPDSQTIATGGDDGTVKLWNLQGKLLYSFEGHTRPIEYIAYSPDGQTIATASLDKTVKLWNLQGKLLYTLEGHTRPLDHIAFSPNGKTIASVDNDGTVNLWNLKGELLHSQQGRKDTIQSTSQALRAADIKYHIEYSPDGNLMVTAGKDGTVNLWDLQEKLILPRNDHTDSVTQIEYSPDGQTIASVSIDGTVKLLNLPEKSTLEFYPDIDSLEVFTDGVSQIAYSPDGKLMAAVSRDGEAKLLNLREKLLLSLEGHTDIVSQIAYSSDGQTIASASMDGTVKLWNLQGELLHSFKGHNQGFLVHIAYSPNGQTITSASMDGTVKLWNLQGELLHSLNGINYIAYSPDGKTIATASMDRTVKLWNLQGELLHSFKGHTKLINKVVYSPDGKTIATASMDGTVKLWNLQGELLHSLKSHNTGVSKIAFSSDGKTIATAGRKTPVLPYREDYEIVKLWNLQGKLINILEGHTDGVDYIRYSPDSQTIAIASGKTVKFWNLEGKSLYAFKGHDGGVTDIVYSPDGKTITTASNYGTVKFWNLEGESLYAFKGHDGGVTDIVYSPDSQAIAIASGKTVKFWSFDLNNVLERGCDWARDYLTNNPNVSEEDKKICDGV